MLFTHDEGLWSYHIVLEEVRWMRWEQYDHLPAADEDNQEGDDGTIVSPHACLVIGVGEPDPLVFRDMDGSGDLRKMYDALLCELREMRGETSLVRCGVPSETLLGVPPDTRRLVDVYTCSKHRYSGAKPCFACKQESV